MEDDGYYNEERVLSDDYVKVTYKGNTAVLPRVIKRGELKKLNRDFESIIMGPNRKRLFSKAAHACEKQAAALAEYRLSRNPDAFSYMKKKCRDMAIRYIEEKTQEEFVEFLKLGTVSNKIIPELLSIASKKEKTIVVAYLMERLGKSNNTQEVFDKAIDDTFDLGQKKPLISQRLFLSYAFNASSIFFFASSFVSNQSTYISFVFASRKLSSGFVAVSTTSVISETT